MLNVTKAEIEFSWQGVMLRTGGKLWEHWQVAPLYLYWHRSGYSSVSVLFLRASQFLDGKAKKPFLYQALSNESGMFL